MVLYRHLLQFLVTSCNLERSFLANRGCPSTSCFLFLLIPLMGQKHSLALARNLDTSFQAISKSCSPTPYILPHFRKSICNFLDKFLKCPMSRLSYILQQSGIRPWHPDTLSSDYIGSSDIWCQASLFPTHAANQLFAFHITKCLSSLPLALSCRLWKQSFLP